MAAVAGRDRREAPRRRERFFEGYVADLIGRDVGSAGEGPVGGLLENFVLGGLARQLTWSRTSARLYHYRDRDQHEVDGTVVGVEVKAAETVRSEDFAGLRTLRRRLGDRFRAGFVLYCGNQSLSFGDGLTCLPLSALWTTPALE